MGRLSNSNYSAAGTIAIAALVFGIFDHFSIGVLSLSTCLPKHPCSLQQQHRQQQSVNSNRNRAKSSSRLDARLDIDEDNVFLHEVPTTNHRRKFLRDQFVGAGTMAAATTLWSSKPPVASAKAPKSRTEGYEVQRTEREWAYILSGAQYNILRKGGTERQKSSILNTFTATDNVGTYVCAACKTSLFASANKFNSGTGWPSFAKATEGVEAEAVNPISATLGGREVRCGTCGGHLGDLFNDGWIYVGTQAFETGSRYCIDGAALVFQPADGGDVVFGDQPPPNKVINYEQTMFRDKSVNGR